MSVMWCNGLRRNKDWRGGAIPRAGEDATTVRGGASRYFASMHPQLRVELNPRPVPGDATGLRALRQDRPQV